MSPSEKVDVDVLVCKPTTICSSSVCDNRDQHSSEPSFRNSSEVRVGSLFAKRWSLRWSAEAISRSSTRASGAGDAAPPPEPDSASCCKKLSMRFAARASFRAMLSSTTRAIPFKDGFANYLNVKFII